MENILYEQHEHTGLLTISRPKALNALNSALLGELSAQLDELAESGIRCLIVTGAGEKAFVAGADITEMLDLNPEQAASFSDLGNGVLEKLENFHSPVIAAVNGFALGGGCELSLACDIRIASENAVFALPELGLGIIPGYGGLQRLSRLVGLGMARELVYTGRKVQAAEAKELGLVNRVLPPAELLDKCRELAGQIARNAPLAVKAAKKVINANIGLELAASYRLERTPFASMFSTADRQNAMSAFVEKKKPMPFTGK
ncbi:MAG: enoyl-CoA hydratase/isomerase family protein [Candidatus Adiutrix sp.]|jgi:enoyl-CoA hydratase|nr:enoyl-CoA hydratase/isomerase family protein [Candidatus Adiutrix sp.]